MRRAQRDIYVQRRQPACLRIASPLAVNSTSPVTSLSKKPGLWSNLKGSSEAITHSYANQKDAEAHRGRAAKVRKTVQRVITVNAILSWAVTGLGYGIVSKQQSQNLQDILLCEAFKVTVGFLSLLQVLLVIWYRNFSLNYQEAVRLALLLSPMPIKRLKKSPKHIVQSILESLLHVVTMVPNFDHPISYSILGISLNTLLFLLLLLRNYHTLQMLYWWSPFSDLRTQHYAKIANLTVSSKFVARCYLATSGAVIVFSLYAVMVAISGLFQYSIDQDTAEGGVDIWGKFWEVTVTQGTIGYGDSAPVTTFGQVTIVISCFCGIAVLSFGNIISQSHLGLNLRQSAMTSELLYRRAKQGYRLEAALILQKWWRLMKMRMMKFKQRQTIVAFYSYLLTFRQVLAACRQVKAHRFEGQITAFDLSIHKQFNALNEYMSPLKEVHTFLPDLLRNQYKILTATQELHHPFQHLIRTAHEKVSTQHSSSYKGEKSCRTGASTRKRAARGNQGFAKACSAAMQNRKSRLARAEIAPETPRVPDMHLRVPTVAL